MGPIGCPETSVRNYHYSLCNDPEERSSLLLRGGSLKSRNVIKMGCLTSGFRRGVNEICDLLEFYAAYNVMQFVTDVSG